MTIPADAQYSDDGAYWWDESAAEWRLVDAQTSAAETPEQETSEAETAEEGDVTLDWEYDGGEVSMDFTVDELVASGWVPESDGTEELA